MFNGGKRRPGEGPESRSKNFSAAMKRLIKELRGLKFLVALGILLAVGGSILTIVAPGFIADLTDEVAKGLGFVPGVDINFDTVHGILILMVILYGSAALVELGEGLIMSHVSNVFARDLRERISKKINLLPLKYFDNHQTGDVLSRVTNDVDTVATSLNTSLSTIISEAALMIGVAIMMFVTNWTLALVAVGASIIGFIGMGAILGKSQKYFEMRQKELGKLNAHIEEVYSGLEIVKAYNGKADSDKKFDRLNKRVYTANQRSQFLSGLMSPIMIFIGNFDYVAVCIVGALLTADHIISFGVIVAFITYVRLFTSPLQRIAQSATSLQSAAAASERVFEFIDEKEMPQQKLTSQKIDKNSIRGDIEFRHVKFGYNDDKLIIKDFSAEAKAGQKIAIVDPTGAGKTTTVNLLM